MMGRYVLSGQMPAYLIVLLRAVSVKFLLGSCQGNVDLLLKCERSKDLDALHFFMFWGKEAGEHGPKTPLSRAE